MLDVRGLLKTLTHVSLCGRNQTSCDSRDRDPHHNHKLCSQGCMWTSHRMIQTHQENYAQPQQKPALFLLHLLRRCFAIPALALPVAVGILAAPLGSLEGRQRASFLQVKGADIRLVSLSGMCMQCTVCAQTPTPWLAALVSGTQCPPAQMSHLTCVVRLVRADANLPG